MEINQTFRKKLIYGASLIFFHETPANALVFHQSSVAGVMVGLGEQM